MLPNSSVVPDDMVEVKVLVEVLVEVDVVDVLVVVVVDPPP